MSVAVVGAVGLGQYEEAAVIVVLFGIGEAMESYGLQRSRHALKRLIDHAPQTVQIKGQDLRTPVSEIPVGTMIAIKPGERVPLDGNVVFGTALVDEAAITGEATPKTKLAGDTVYAGSITSQGYLEVRTTTREQNTALHKIVELTYRAAERKSRAQRFIERFASIYTPGVMVAAVAIAVWGPVLGGLSWGMAIERALVLLVISCPCALVLSTPVSVFSAIGHASQLGAVIKGGQFIEEMGRLTAIAFDKTRTLTKGQLAVTKIIPMPGFSEADVVACAAGMERFSEHPLAKGLMDYASRQGWDPHHFTEFQAVAGKGLSGTCTICTDAHHCLGSLSFVSQDHSVTEDVVKQVSALEAEGNTVLVMADANGVKGVIGLSDEIRPESKILIDRLRHYHIVPMIVTGDNAAAARFVGEHVGILEIKAGLLPDEKEAFLRDQILHYAHVGMVGDGINDAPALAAASVGIAMGAVGSDVAIENADIALMNDNLLVIADLVALGRRTVAMIRFNVLFAVMVKVVFVVAALWGVVHLALAIFADVGVTIIVVLNGLRLYTSR